MNPVPYLLGKNSVTVMVNGATHTVTKEQANYAGLLDAIRNQAWETIADLLTPARAVENFGAGMIRVENGQVLYNGTVLRNGITVRILDMIAQGFDAQPLVRFLNKLMSNPSKIAVDELYDWLEGTSLPITEDGDFMAYKKVRDDYRDFYTGKVLNKPAELMTDAELASLARPMNGVTVSVVDGVTVISMPRNQVDDRRDRTCSQGLHFCSLSYLPNYHGGSGRVLLVKVNPANVVSIPSDYDFAKGRAWCYAIVGEHTQGERTEAFETPVVTNAGKATKTAARREQDAAVRTTVLGVNFEIQARADMVRALVSSVTHRATATAGRTAEQGRVDGFDDAWYDRQPELARFVGSNVREAVDYARAYFEGYDRMRKGNTATVQQTAARAEADLAQGFAYVNDTQRAEIARVINMPLGTNTYNHGYQAGVEDGTAEGAYDRHQGVKFDLATAEDAGAKYRRGYITGYLAAYNG